MQTKVIIREVFARVTTESAKYLELIISSLGNTVYASAQSVKHDLAESQKYSGHVNKFINKPQICVYTLAVRSISTLGHFRLKIDRFQ